MVAIVGGNALGLGLGSMATLGARGVWGQAAHGRSGEGAFVNAATGNLVLQGRDDLLAARGLDLASTRTYNSQGLLNDDNGDNWSLGFYTRAIRLSGTRNTAGSTVTKTDRDGGESTFTWDSGRGLYVTTAGSGAHDTIVYETATTQWLWSDGDTGLQERYESAVAGRLLSSKDVDGHAVSYAYNGAGLLTSAASANGETVHYDYTGTLLTQVRTVHLVGSTPTTLTRARYAYDASDRLSSVTVDLSPGDNSVVDGKTYVTTYIYDGASRRVASALHSDGSGLRFTYVQVGSEWRVATVRDALGQTTSFTYDGANRRTTVTSPLGAATTYSHDADGQLLQVTAPLGQSTSFAWDASGNLARTTDAEGRTVDMAYDTNGNQTLVRDAAGNTVARTFSATNLLLTETTYAVVDLDGSGPAQPSKPMTKRQVWDFAGKRSLRFTISAEGRIVEHRYNGYGERVATIAYAGSVFPVGSLGSTEVPTEAEMTTWSATQDLSRTQRTDYAYDPRGLLQTAITYTTVDGEGSGVADADSSVTRYVHDQAGRLLKTIAPGGGGVETTFDGLGRVLTVTDALGRVTTHQYQDADRKTAVTLANGLVTTSLWDAAGRLVSVIAGTSGVAVLGETKWFHDSEGRLRMTQDPTGVRNWLLYDEAGRQVAGIDADGTLTEHAYDRSDRPTRTIVYATRVDTALLVDGDGAPSNVTLAALRPATTAADRADWRAYDAAGRLVGTVNAAGAVVASFHDGASRLVKQVAYANRIATASLGAAPSASGLQPIVDAAADRVTRWFHDGEGRVVGVLDAEGYLVESRYDSAGRLSTTTRYATATPIGQRDSGSLLALRPATHADDQTTTLLYNAKGQVAGIVDADLRLTEKVYDANGNLARVVRYANRLAAVPDASATVASVRPAGDAEDRATAWTYDVLDRPSEETSADGTVTRFGYDTAGNLLTTTLAYGHAEMRSLHARHDVQGRLVAELSGEGGALLTGDQTQAEIDAIWARHGIAHAYDAAGRRISTTDPNGDKTLFFYDADGRRTHIVNALGEVDERLYDAFGQLASTARLGTRIARTGLSGGLNDGTLTNAIAAARNAALDSREAFAYGVTGSLATSTDALGHVTSRTVNTFDETVATLVPLGGGATRLDLSAFDRRGLELASTRDANGIAAFRQSNFDAFGRLVRSVDSNGNVRQQVFDRIGRVVQTTDPLGAVRSTTWDAFDRVLVQTDALGHSTTTRHSTSGRSVTVTTPEGVSVTTVRNAHGEVASVRDGKGSTTTYVYDRDGRLVETATPLTLERRAYDRAGRLVDSTDARGVHTAIGYDATGRVLSRTVDPAGLALTTRWTFDAQGRSIRVVDPSGVVTSTDYDRAGRTVRQVVDPDGLSLATTWTWNPAGQALTVAEPSGTVTLLTYDALGRRVREQIDPNGLDLTRRWTYDAEGNAVAATDAAGHTSRFVYDAAGRQIWSVDAGGGAIRTSYDGEGRIVRVDRHATAIDTASLPIVASAAQIESHAVIVAARDQTETRRYDRDGRLRFTVDGAGGVVEQRLDGSGNVVERIAYAKAIDLASWNLASEPPVLADPSRDRRTRVVYDALDRATHVADAAGGVVRTVYDAGGNVVVRIAHATPVADGASPVDVAVSAEDRVERIAYDAAGRRVFAVDALGGVTESTLDASGRLVARREYAREIAVGGQAALDATQIRAAIAPDASHDRVTRFRHDAAGRLVWTVDAMGGVTQDVLDAAGRTVVRVAYATAIGDGIEPVHVPHAAKDRVTRFAHDAAGREVFAVDATGAVVEKVHDAAGREVERRAFAIRLAPTGGSEALSETQIRGALVADAAHDRRSVFTRNAAGHLVAQTLAAGTAAEATTLYRVDAIGRRTAETEARGVALATADTPWARSERARLGLPTSLAALDSFQRQALLDGFTTTLVHDAAGRLVSTSAPTSTTSTEYDAFGDAVRMIDPLGNAGTFWFDRLGRVVLQVDPEGRAVETVYAGTARDLVASVRRYAQRVPSAHPGTRPALATDVRDAVVLNVHDKLGRLVSTTDATSPTERVEHGVAGDRFARRVTNRLGGIATYAYDRMGRQLSETLPVTSRDGSGVEVTVVNRHAYAAFGDRIHSVEAAGLPEQRTTTFQYDAAGRLLHRIGVAVAVLDPVTLSSVSATPVDSTRYDAFGDAVETIVRATWDGSAATGGARTLTWRDAGGRVVATAAADGAVVSFVRDPAGLVAREVAHANRVDMPAAAPTEAPAVAPDPVRDRATVRVHDAAGREISSQREMVVHWEQTGSGSAITLDLAGTQPGTVTLVRSRYDAAGNVLQETDGRGSSTFHWYDAVGRRVLTVDAEGYATAWTYDDLLDVATRETRHATQLAGWPDGDPARKPVPVAAAGDRVTQFVLDRVGRVLERSVLGVAFETVDASGNVVRGTASASTRFTYDGLGNVTRQAERVADGSDAWNVTDVVHDALGREVERREPGYADHRGFDVRPRKSTEYDGLGGLRRVVARGEDDASEADDRITAFRYDANGDRTEVVDAGFHVTRFELDAQGRVARSTFVAVRDAGGIGRDVATLFRYDAMGRTTMQTDVGTGEVRKTSYDAFGQIVAKGIGDGWQEFVEYSTLGKIQKSNSGDGVVRIHLHDANGNATREIRSASVDLTTVSVLAAARDGSLLHTFSSHDRRNLLVRTVEPDISYLQDKVGLQGAFSQRLADLYGAITVGNSGGGAYAQNTIDTASDGLTRVAGSNGSDPMASAAPPTANGAIAPADAGPPRALAAVGAMGFSVAWSGQARATSSPLAFSVPGSLPYGEYRVRRDSNGTVLGQGLRGTSIPISGYGSFSLEIRVGAGNQWVRISQLTVDQEDLIPLQRIWRSIESPDVFVEGLTHGGFAVLNDGTTAAQGLGMAQVRDVAGAVVAGWYRVTPPIGGGPHAIVVRGLDNRSLVDRVAAFNVWTGDGATVAATPFASRDLASFVTGSMRTVLLDSGKVDGSGTFFFRERGSGADYTGIGFVNGMVQTGVATLSPSKSYECLVVANGKEFHGVLNADLTETRLWWAGRPPARIAQFDASAQLAGLSGPYDFELLIAGRSKTLAGVTGPRFAVDVADCVNPYGNVSVPYSYRIWAQRPGGHRALVGQGSGDASIGVDSRPSSITVSDHRPIGKLERNGVLDGVLTLTSGAQSATIDKNDWRWIGDAGRFGIDLSQFLSSTPRMVDFDYAASDGRFRGTFSLQPNGQTDLVAGSLHVSVRRPFIPITVDGAVSLSTLRVGPVGGPLDDVSAGRVTRTGSTFTWDASDQVGTRRYEYEARNAAGVVIGKGQGIFTLAGDGSLSYAPETTLLPSVLRFQPPAGATTFELTLRPGTPGAVTYAELALDGGERLFDASSLRSVTSDVSEAFRFVARDGAGRILSSGSGTITVRTDGSTSTTQTPDRPDTVVSLQGPPGRDVPKLQLDRRAVGATGPYTSVTLSGSYDSQVGKSVFAWNATTAMPPEGTLHQEFVLRLLNADGTVFRNEVGDPIEIRGVMTLGAATTEPVRMQQYVTQFAQQAQVTRLQTHNAFGEVAEEYDDRVFQRMQEMVALHGGTADPTAARTTFTYNALGRLIAKTDPQTDIVLATDTATEAARSRTTGTTSREGRRPSPMPTGTPASSASPAPGNASWRSGRATAVASLRGTTSSETSGSGWTSSATSSWRPRTRSGT